MHNGEPHEVEIHQIFQEVRSVMGNYKLFYHLLQTLGDIQACVWEKLADEATRFANFPLPHLIRHLKIDNDNLMAAQVTFREAITN